MIYDKLIEELALTLLTKARYEGCISVIDGFSQCEEDKTRMQRGVQVTATEYSLRDRVNMFRLARRIERYATRKGLQLPW